MFDEYTEEYAIWAEKQENLWHEKYGEAETVFLRAVDSAILNGDSDKFCELISDESNQYIFGNRPSYMEARLIYVMRMNEIEHVSDKNVILIGQNLIELVETVVTIPRFLLWRFELAKDADAAVELLDFVNEKGISMFAVNVLISTTSVNIKKVFIQLSQICLDRRDYMSTIVLLSGLCDVFPDDLEAKQLYEGMVGFVKGGLSAELN